MTKSKESSAQALLRIAKRERVIKVKIGGDTIELTKPNAVKYQDLIDKAQNLQTGDDSIDAANAIDLYAEILAASVPDLEIDDAREVIIGVGINSPLTKACLQVLGTAETQINDTMGKL